MKNKLIQVQSLQFDKFIIEDWFCIDDTCWRRYIVDTTSTASHYHIVSYLELTFNSNDGLWGFDIYHNIINNLYYKMYPTSKSQSFLFLPYCQVFNCLEEGKKFVDTFLNKLVKMKAFL